MKIAVFGKEVYSSHNQSIQHLFACLKAMKFQMIVYRPFQEELLKKEVGEVADAETFYEHNSLEGKQIDFLISIGGDGTFLDSILFVSNLKIPILGINTGRLGFLSNTSTDEIETALKNLAQGKFSLEKRNLLQLESKSRLFGNNNLALNEISIMKRDSSSMITIHVDLDGVHLNSYWTDGLIISTSTGSTAYSLSCGGPIIMPGNGNFVITPIAPHNLNVRPIVINDESILKIKVESRSKNNLVALDSRSVELQDGEILKIKKATNNIELVQFEHQSFLHSLRTKLNWGLDKRNSNV